MNQNESNRTNIYSFQASSWSSRQKKLWRETCSATSYHILDSSNIGLHVIWYIPIFTDFIYVLGLRFWGFMLFSESFSIFSGILCSRKTMEMRRHFGERAKEKEPKYDFSSRFRGSINQHTTGVDWHQFWSRKVQDAFKCTEVEICPKRLPYLHY